MIINPYQILQLKCSRTSAMKRKGEQTTLKTTKTQMAIASINQSGKFI